MRSGFVVSVQLQLVELHPQVVVGGVCHLCVVVTWVARAQQAVHCTLVRIRATAADLALVNQTQVAFALHAQSENKMNVADGERK